MKKKTKTIPKFKTIAEEAEFWDTHSFADYWDQFKDFDLEVNLHNKPKEETLILRLQKEVRDKIEYLAKKRGLNVSALARIWLIEKLRTVNPGKT